MSEEQGGFRKGRGCVDQIFTRNRLVEEYLGKYKKLSAAVYVSRYDRVDREAFWSVLKIYGVGRQLLTFRTQDGILELLKMKSCGSALRKTYILLHQKFH